MVEIEVERTTEKLQIRGTHLLSFGSAFADLSPAQTLLLLRRRFYHRHHHHHQQQQQQQQQQMCRQASACRWRDRR
jgi:hypothetical protein